MHLRLEILIGIAISPIVIGPNGTPLQRGRVMDLGGYGGLGGLGGGLGRLGGGFLYVNLWFCDDLHVFVC